MKDEPIDTVVGAIRQVLGGKIYLSEKMTENILCKVSGTQIDEFTRAFQKLSDRELEVFELVGQGKTTKEIATQLSLSVRTIEAYKDHLKTKLNLSNTTKLVNRATLWLQSV